MIMKIEEDEIIKKEINKYENELKNSLPEEIAANVGLNNIDKFIDENNNLKDIRNKNGGKQGIPWHIRGLSNYRKILQELNLFNKYDDLNNGDKSKVVYLKKNPYGFDSFTFIRWPKEVEEYGIVVDYNKMIETYFRGKIKMLFEVTKKNHLMENNVSLDLFF